MAKLKAQTKAATTQLDATASVRHVTLKISDETPTMTAQHSQPISLGVRVTRNKEVRQTLFEMA